MDYYISVALIAAAALMTSFITLPVFKILQLSGYKARGLFAWFKSTKYDLPIRYIALTIMSFVAVIVYVGCFGAYEYARYCAVALYLALTVVFSVAACKKAAGLKMTARAVRLIIIDCILMLVLGGGIAFASYFSTYCQTLVTALSVLAPIVAVAANTIALPIEKLVHSKYIRAAKNKLAQKHPTVIGITGSFGKTTAKNILAAMLSSSGATVAVTPGSYNTPMGICKTVNDMLGDERYFIAELGARYKGDIKELCGIVKPFCGVITAIGDMHIETLKSRVGVADVKFELADSLPADGFIALNGYNADCAALKDRDCACEKIVAGDGGEVYHGDVKVGKDGTVFELFADGKKFDVKVKLLGAHIADLVCVCAAAALKLGVSAENIVAALDTLEPVEHRLQLVPSKSPEVTVIDDAYNSNPIGAKNALDVLAQTDGKKIIITPGFVELGVIEKDCNTELGRQIAAVCDYAFLIGSRAADIKKGAVSLGMNEDAITVFAARDDAVAALGGITGQKSVLFENDLPDNII